MSTPHRGIVSLLQRAANEKEESSKSEKWMREKVSERLIAATEEAELKSARAGYHRLLAEEQKEQRAEETWRTREREKERKREIDRRSEVTSKELQRIKYEENKENRMKQKVLANSMELRDLERALRESYGKKEQKAQMAERKLREAEEARRQAEIAARLDADDRKAVEDDKRKREEKTLDRLRYQEELEKQLDEIEARKQEAYEAFLREKKEIDAIARKIQEEDEKEWRRKLERKGAMRKFIAEYLEEREAWKRRQEVEIAEENRRIESYLREKEAREKEETERKKTARVEGERVVETLALKLKEEREAEEEVREMAMELAEAKREEEIRLMEMRQFEKRLRQKLQLDKDRREEARLKVERRAMEKKEEAEFRKIMLNKLAEEANLEQLNAEKRRLKEMEHRRAVERLIDDRRRSVLQAKDDERRIFEEEMEEERQRRRIVEEERQRILEAHAQSLLGFLPRGILKASDVARLKPEVRVKFQGAGMEGGDGESGEDDWTIPKRRLVGGKFQ